MAEPLLSRRSLLDVEIATLPAHRSDVLVVGSGIAGLSAVLHCASDYDVALLTKGELTQTNTWYAQGGIAGAVGEADSVEMHIADTLVVGQGLCDETAVRAVVGEAPEALESLLGFGVRFDLAESGIGIALAREGGHSLPRVLHSGDKTGAAIQQALTDTLRIRERIPVFEHRFLVDILAGDDGAAIGALALDAATGALEAHFADAVVLATGGSGQVFPVTTNPTIATGDGVAAAWRAGADVADLEFVQFHPTALDHDAAPRFLVSEAMRGEGAYLLDCDEKRFMPDRHPLAELAPRDIVSREIERVMKRCGRNNVWLDARHLGESYLRARFPAIWAGCADAGYDLSRDLIPVAPAAHYQCGGVLVDVDGRTSVPALYASGEVACTGLHGANRLASNSLLEGLVFSRRIARALGASRSEQTEGDAALAVDPGARGVSIGGAGGDAPREGSPASTASPSAHTFLDASSALECLHETARDGLGMGRDAAGLAEALSRLEELGGRIADVASVPSAGIRGLEIANLVTVASLIARGASMRTESRGCHYRSDYPERDDAHWRQRIVFNRVSGERRVGVAEVTAECSPEQPAGSVRGDG